MVGGMTWGPMWQRRTSTLDKRKHKALDKPRRYFHSILFDMHWRSQKTGPARLKRHFATLLNDVAPTFVLFSITNNRTTKMYSPMLEVVLPILEDVKSAWPSCLWGNSILNSVSVDQKHKRFFLMVLTISFQGLELLRLWRKSWSAR